MTDEPLRIPAPAPGTTEQPTTSALISLGLRPLKIETRADNVPASETRTLVTVFGMIAMGATGILGGGVTMSEAPAAHLGPYLTAAMAQLLLALAVAILIFQWTRPSHSAAGSVLLTTPLPAVEAGEPRQDQAEGLTG